MGPTSAAQGFNASGDAYDLFMGRYSRSLAAPFADAAGIEPGRSALDVGCGPGWLAEALVAQGHHVTGVDFAADPGVHDRMHQFVQTDLEHGLPDEVGGDFDVVLAADVIEHVRNPQQLLTEMAHRLRPGGTVIASVPNISHWYPRGRTALGLFDYDQRGILDSTHVRFFTRRSFVRLAQQAGLQPIDRRHTGLPFDALKMSTDRGFGRIAALVDRALVRAWPTMFAYQFVYELDVNPALDQPLDEQHRDKPDAPDVATDRPG